MADFQILRFRRFNVLGARKFFVALLHFLDVWIAPILDTGVMYCNSVKINLLLPFLPSSVACPDPEKILKFFDADPDPDPRKEILSTLEKGSCQPWIRNPRWKNLDPGSWIRDKHPGSATLLPSVSKRSDRVSYPERFFRIRNRPEQKSSGSDQTRVHLSLTFLQN